jgi:ABC-2 type transport system permease protein
MIGLLAGRGLPGRLARIAAVARVELLHLLRDRTTIALVVTLPAVQVALFGYAVNLDPRPITVAIARDGADPTDPVRRAIESTGYFSVLADGLEPGAAERMVAEGRALVGLELARGAAGPLPGVHARSARLVVDATDGAAVRPALAALETAYWRRLAEAASPLRAPTVEVQWLHNPGGRTAWTIVPGLAGVIVMISMLMLGALTLVRERERGSWETLLATPVDAADALIGKLAPYLAIGTVQAAVVIGVARLLFDLPLRGSVVALLAAAPLYAAAHLILGFAFSAVAESQMQAIQGAVFFYLPSMLLSGFMFPFEGMPGWARAIGEALPLTHFVRAARGVLLRGEGPAFVAAEMWPVALFALVATAAALAAYRRRLD